MHILTGSTRRDASDRMIAVQLIIDQDALAQMGRPEGIPSMQGEVLQYLQRGDIERVE